MARRKGLAAVAAAPAAPVWPDDPDVVEQVTVPADWEGLIGQDRLAVAAGRRALAEAVEGLRRRDVRAERFTEALQALATVTARISQYERILSAEGPMVMTVSGRPLAHPLLGTLDQLRRSQRALLAELGMTPKAAATLPAEAPPFDPDDPFCV